MRIVWRKGHRSPGGHGGMSSMMLEGDAWRFGRNVDTDVIIPARYLDTTDVKELASHCMEDLDPDFCTRVK